MLASPIHAAAAPTVVIFVIPDVNIYHVVLVVILVATVVVNETVVVATFLSVKLRVMPFGLQCLKKVVVPNLFVW